MKKRKNLVAPPEAASTIFLRGFLTVALVEAARRGAGDRRRLAVAAVQGGAALAAATIAAREIARKNYTTAAIAFASGAAGVVLAAQLAAPEPTDHIVFNSQETEIG